MKILVSVTISILFRIETYDSFFRSIDDSHNSTFLASLMYCLYHYVCGREINQNRCNAREMIKFKYRCHVLSEHQTGSGQAQLCPPSLPRQKQMLQFVVCSLLFSVVLKGGRLIIRKNNTLPLLPVDKKKNSNFIY